MMVCDVRLSVIDVILIMCDVMFSSRQRGDELGDMRDQLNLVTSERDAMSRRVDALTTELEERATVRLNCCCTSGLQTRF